MARAQHRILSVASECAPLVKTGGLADVVGALPAALSPFGWHTRVLIPAYRGVREQLGKTRTLWRDENLFGGPAVVRFGHTDTLDVLILDAPHLFDRAGGPYNVDGHDFPDNHIRFAALSWVAARIAIDGLSDRWRPDIVHAHDWHAGLTPAYLKYAESHVPSVLTVHNIAFQGMFAADQLAILRLPTWDFHADGLEYHGQGSALKAGLTFASRVTTVSPTYAREITTPEFGFGLEGIVRARRERGELIGILNGIDTTVWNPATDPHITQYSAANAAEKQKNRDELIAEFGLAQPNGPLAVVVTRLTHQKGIDLLLEAAPQFIEAGGALIVLGSGDPNYEHGLRELAAAYPHSVGVTIGYDEALSHRLFAGGDLVLVPSRFEPCGLTQLYGLAYGAAPVVAATGGLRDSVVDATPESLLDGTATGFTFSEIHADGLRSALRRAVELYRKSDGWQQLRSQAMTASFDWARSAAKYAALFSQLTA